MSITRLQQARQMYAMGQRVAKTLDGSRPGYRGDNAYGGGRSSGSSSNSSGPAGGASAGGNYGGDSSGGTSANDMSNTRNEGPAGSRPGNNNTVDPGFQNALRNQQVIQNTITQSQDPNFGQFFGSRVPTYQKPTLGQRGGGFGNAIFGGILGLINPLAGLAFKGYNYVKNKAPETFQNFKSSNTLEEFRDKMRGYGKTMPTYSTNPAFGGIETLGVDVPQIEDEMDLNNIASLIAASQVPQKTNFPSNDLMAGLTRMQKMGLKSKKSNVKKGLMSPQEALDSISPFNDKEDPATLEEVKEYYGIV